MLFFITFMRALAACLITNAHYSGVYPAEIIANGGLIGDVIFFAVSGYCLYNVKYDFSLNGFVRWYGKRIWRVYPPVLIITFAYMVLGKYDYSEHGPMWWYIYPTYYHFVASIIILYIPYFIIMKICWLRQRILQVMLVIAILWLSVFWFFYDRSYYHIDTVREPMIRFLFFESMLLGAWFRENDVKVRNSFNLKYPILSVFSFFAYFASKLLFAKVEKLASYQFLNQITIFILLYFLFRTFYSMDEKLEHLPGKIKSLIFFISDMTLEIYVVQYVIITEIRRLDLVFPLNWFFLTTSIIVAAYILHKTCEIILKFVNRILLVKKI